MWPLLESRISLDRTCRGRLRHNRIIISKSPVTRQIFPTLPFLPAFFNSLLPSLIPTKLSLSHFSHDNYLTLPEIPIDVRFVFWHFVLREVRLIHISHIATLLFQVCFAQLRWVRVAGFCLFDDHLIVWFWGVATQAKDANVGEGGEGEGGRCGDGDGAPGVATWGILLFFGQLTIFNLCPQIRQFLLLFQC